MQPDAGDPLSADAGLIDFRGPGKDRPAINVCRRQVGLESPQTDAAGRNAPSARFHRRILATVHDLKREVRLDRSRQLLEHNRSEVIEIEADDLVPA